MGVDLDSVVPESRFKKRKVSLDGHYSSSLCSISYQIQTSLPTLQASDYFTEPSLTELTMRELVDPGHSQRVQDFTVGRYGYGKVKFFGETDVRWLDLDNIIKFKRHEIVVYEDETCKPVIGKGLNKPAEVTLLLQITPLLKSQVIEKLKASAERQGAKFISFDLNKKEWKFTVQHFSRFGLSDNEEEDITMDDADSDSDVQEPIPMLDSDNSDPHLLSHSLPSHLGLDPIRMKEMQMVMFPNEEDDDYEENQEEELNDTFSHSHHKQATRSPIRCYPPRTIRKTPLPLLEYNPSSFMSSTQPGSILLTQQKKPPLPLAITKVQGFKMETNETPVSKRLSRNLVDAGLFMGRSFGISFGPNNLLLSSNSSIINIQKPAYNNIVKDENNKVREELIESCFDSPLNLHKQIAHESKEVSVDDDHKIKIQKLVCDGFSLSHICRSYISIIEKQLEVNGLSSKSRVMLVHQVLVWELIKVLFSSRETSESDTDTESLPLIRRAEFSYWLQESVCHRVQEEISSLNESSTDLKQLFLLLTGRQLDTAVEISAAKGDVRLACLLSQAGGSMVNRSDLNRQLTLWKTNGLDFNFIEEDRIKIFELLAGNVHASLGDMEIDWKRFLGLVMWYQLSPDSDLKTIFHMYHKYLQCGQAPYPVPVYIDEGVFDTGHTDAHFDLAYYLMIVYAFKEREVASIIKTMFSAFASTYDPLDNHMIWHQRAVLESVGVFRCDDLHVLDMGFVSQLLCVGRCDWAIYVVLHMSVREDYPDLQARVVKEILFQFCETWSGQESQRQFIEDLGVPSAWLHEALAIYHSYYGNSLSALEHYLGCGFWQKAHVTFMNLVAHSLFLSGKHSEIWRLVSSIEDHKSEIENWDVGAGIYMTFYTLRSSLEEDDDNTMTEFVSLKKKNDECKEFFSRLKESLAVWDKLPINARMVYAKMGEEISELLVADPGVGSTIEDKLECFSTIFDSPIPDDLRSCHLQSAISHFALHLTEAAS